MNSVEEYERQIANAVFMYEGYPLTPSTIAQIHATVIQIQQIFLMENADFVAPYSPKIDVVDTYNIRIDAPIVTVWEKLESDNLARERDRCLAELVANQKIEDQRARRARHNMERLHRRLEAKYLDRIPLATRRIWPTLTTGQQYAILKDIDYSIRHGKSAP